LKLKFSFKSEDYEKKLKAVLDKVFAAANMAKWMQETADEIKLRTRMGYGVEKDYATKKKFDGLSPAYIEFRKGEKQSKKNPGGELSKATSPTRSNLTYTGQMLDALRGRSAGKYQGEIWLKDERKPTKRQTRSFGNNNLAVWNAEKGRNFMAISDLEFKRLNQKIEKVLTEEIRQAFGKK
jgi:hypothetical protein